MRAILALQHSSPVPILPHIRLIRIKKKSLLVFHGNTLFPIRDEPIWSTRVAPLGVKQNWCGVLEIIQIF